MNIKFNKIQLHNFMSFIDSTIILDSSGYTLVSGENNNSDDNSASNGSGKSTILEAILFTLTGSTMRGITGKDVLKRGEKECYTTLWFSVDNSEYKITRSIPSKLEIIKDDEDISGKGIKASTQILNENLPEITTDLLSNIVILGQGLPNKFSSNTPSGRKEILEKLFKADYMIEDIKNRISSRISSLKDEQRSLEDSILSIRSKLEVIRETISINSIELSKLEDPENLITQLDKYNIEIDKLEQQLSDVHSYNKNIQEDNTKINKKIAELSTQKMKVVEDEYLIKEIDEIKEKGTSLKNEAIILEKEIKKKDSITDVCPTCGQKLVGVEKPDTSADKKQLKSMNEELAELRIELKEVQDKRNNYINTKIAKLDEKYNELISNIKEIKDASSIENKIQEIKEKTNSINVEISSYKNKKLELSKNIERDESTVKELEKQVDSLLTEKLKLDSRLDVDNKINTIIKRDFRGYLLFNIIDLLNNTFKSYSKEVFGHDKAEIKQDNNNILINFNNKPYENLSGGEKKKLDICIQLALKDALSKYNNVYSNILALDEIFDELDVKGAEQIIDVITNKVNVPSVYIISHNSDIENILPIDNKIIVKKNNKGSTAVQM